MGSQKILSLPREGFPFIDPVDAERMNERTLSLCGEYLNDLELC